MNDPTKKFIDDLRAVFTKHDVKIDVDESYQEVDVGEMLVITTVVKRRSTPSDDEAEVVYIEVDELLKHLVGC